MPEQPALIIAEAGINHDGSLSRALEMVDAAAAAGADVVKFQSFRAERLVTADALMSSYIVEGKQPDESFRDVLSRLQIDREGFVALAERCRAAGIEFLSTPFDVESLDELIELGVGRLKIASGDLTHLPMLTAMAERGLPTILSTGMATLGEIERALEAIVVRGGNDRVTLLHCISWYPANFESVNLRYMETLRSAFGLPVGYSDHTLGTSAPIAARALGACCVEKHFTLDSRAFGPDHAASIEPPELAAMVRGIRETERMLGTTSRRFDREELGQREVHRRSLVAARPIAAGERFTECNLTAKRPGTGIAPRHLERLLGRRASRALTVDRVLCWEDVDSGERCADVEGSVTSLAG